MTADELRRLRLEVAALAGGIGGLPVGAAPEPSRYVGRVYDAGKMPSTVPGYFATHPVTIGGPEGEGETPTLVTAAATVYVLVLGKVPQLGDLLIARSIGSRWVAWTGSSRKGGYTVWAVGCNDAKLAGVQVTFPYPGGKTVTTDADGGADFDASSVPPTGRPVARLVPTADQAPFVTTDITYLGINFVIVHWTTDQRPTRPKFGVPSLNFDTTEFKCLSNSKCEIPIPVVIEIDDSRVDATCTLTAQAEGFGPIYATWVGNTTVTANSMELIPPHGFPTGCDPATEGDHPVGVQYNLTGSIPNSVADGRYGRIQATFDGCPISGFVGNQAFIAITGGGTGFLCIFQVAGVEATPLYTNGGAATLIENDGASRPPGIAVAQGPYKGQGTTYTIRW